MNRPWTHGGGRARESSKRPLLPSGPGVISALANAGQVVLYFMYWERWRDSHVWSATPTWDLDWSLPWSDPVESARKAALDTARAAGTPPETFATVSWIDESDR